MKIPKIVIHRLENQNFNYCASPLSGLNEEGRKKHFKRLEKEYPIRAIVFQSDLCNN